MTVPAATVTGLAPVILPPNPVFRFYTRRGGDRSSCAESPPGTGPGAPEDWVGSTTTSFGHDDGGARDARRRPRPARRDRLGPCRLPRRRARGPLRRQPGTAREAARRRRAPGGALPPGPRVRAGASSLGLWQDGGLDHPRRPNQVLICTSACASRSTPRRSSAGSSSRTRKSCWTRSTPVPVAPGDVLFVPAGTLHTIGAGITLIELQEPSDMSVVIEWQLLRGRQRR